MGFERPLSTTSPDAPAVVVVTGADEKVIVLPATAAPVTLNVAVVPPTVIVPPLTASVPPDSTVVIAPPMAHEKPAGRLRVRVPAGMSVVPLAVTTAIGT